MEALPFRSFSGMPAVAVTDIEEQCAVRPQYAPKVSADGRQAVSLPNKLRRESGTGS